MSGLKRLIQEIHGRSLWQVRTGARHRSLLACVSCLALTVLACGRGDDTAYSRGSTVIISYCCGNEALNPSHDMGAINLVFLSLATHDPKGRHGAPRHELGAFARLPGVDAPPGTDVRWHDGVPVTAHDIAFTIDVMRTFWDMDYGAGAFESVTVHDDSTVVIAVAGQVQTGGTSLRRWWTGWKTATRLTSSSRPTVPMEWSIMNGAFALTPSEPFTQALPGVRTIRLIGSRAISPVNELHGGSEKDHTLGGASW